MAVDRDWGQSRPCHSPARPSRQTLRAHRTRQLEDQRTAAGAWPEHGLVFTTEIGTPLRPRNVLRRFEVLAERAGLRGATLHTLRRSTASFLLAAGTHTMVVQEHLGYSSYAITADIYSHVGPAQQRGAADRLDQALRGDRCCPSGRVAVLTRKAGRPLRPTRLRRAVHCRADRS
jgi:integrase